jgi:uncharacterized membrane protein YhaH (DUF805 family)
MLAAMMQSIFGGTVHTVVFYIYIIGIVVPFPALVVRRLHDGGHNMALPISLVIFISVCCGLDKISALIVKGTTIDILCQRAILILLLGILAVFIALIVFLFIGKDKKDNKYGVSTSEIAVLQRKLESLQKSIISNSTEETTCNRQ